MYVSRGDSGDDQFVIIGSPASTVLDLGITGLPMVPPVGSPLGHRAGRGPALASPRPARRPLEAKGTVGVDQF